jgi:tRNA nucleotidyltransferase (CCA-adding enzyme)
MKIYQVGGSIRDLFLNRKSDDIDYTVEISSYEEMKVELGKKYKLIYEKPEFFTIRVKDNMNNILDFTMCRKDGKYTDSRHPDKVIPGTIYDDLTRRDFTMNAIAKNDNEFIDPHNGIKDINNKIIRCVGIAEDRFNEDILRIVRAFRFHITLGFKLDSEIEKCMNDKILIEKLTHVSKERIQKEMNTCFSTNTRTTLVELNNYPLLRDYIFTNILSIKTLILN